VRIVGVVLVLALTAPPAAAQDEVFVDPDSPSGREYAIPLEEARRNAASGGPPSRVQPGERSAELFGAGVGEDGGPPGSAGDPRQGGGGSDSAPGTGGAGDGGAGAVPGADGPGTAGERSGGSLREATTAGSQGDVLLVGAIGVGVLALGAIAGLAGRRRLGARA